MLKYTKAVYFILCFLFTFCAGSLFGQGSIVVGPDTVICSGSTILLHADVTGGYGTENYVFETIPYSPEDYSGTSVILSDDDYDGPFDIGFDFCFMGSTYTHFYFGSNGWISFGGAGALTATYVSEPIPTTDPAAPKNCIMGPWEDWDSQSASGINKYQTIGTAPNRKCVISWDNVPMFDCWAGTADPEFGSFQIVLNEQTSIIENHLTHKPNCLTWFPTGTEGCHSLDGTIAYWAPGRNGTTWTADNESVRFVPSGITWYSAAGVALGYSDTISVSPTSSGIYYAVVTLCDGTEYSDTLSIVVGDDFDVTLDANGVSCNGDTDGSVSVTTAGTGSPLIYEWSTGDAGVTSLSGLPGGDYSITITDTVGCMKTVPFTIDEPAPLVATATVVNAICFGDDNGSATINPTGGTLPYQYSLNGGSPTFVNTFNSLTAGSYVVTITDANGCETTTSFDVTQNDQLIVDAGPDQTILGGSSTTINATTAATDIIGIIWNPGGDSIPCPTEPCFSYFVTPVFTTDYTVTITDADGCTATDTVRIIVNYEPAVYFPTAFSPNGDLINDFYYSIGYNISTYDLKIFNRWGQMIYESLSQGDNTHGWDGTFNGKEQDLGTYIWQADVVFLTGEEFHQTGNFVLIR